MGIPESIGRVGGGQKANKIKLAVSTILLHSEQHKSATKFGGFSNKQEMCIIIRGKNGYFVL